MIAALFYLQVHSLKNRMLSRLRRLKRPKYLAGAVAGGLYMYWFFLRPWIGPGRHAASVSPTIPVELGPAFEHLAAGGLLAILFLAWIWPHKRAALEFSEAEVAFLFPAPVTRRTLVHYKLLKSQAAILLSAFFVTLFSGRLSRGSAGGTYYAGLWLLLSTINLHLLGCSFGQTMLLDRGISSRKVRFAILALVAAVLGATFLWIRHAVVPPSAEVFASLRSLAEYIQQVCLSGPLPFLLYPFRLAVRPMLAANGHAFLLALGPALALLALHYGWVMASDVAFEEASVEAARRRAEKIAAVRAGKDPFAAATTKRRHKPPFRLHPTGPRFIALLWKNLIAAGQMFTLRLWLILAWVAIMMAIMASLMTERSGILVVVGVFALGLFAMSLIMGPQLLRADLRQDMAAADLLKTYPLRGWHVVLGEILAPALILTGAQWLLLVVALGASGAGPSGQRFPFVHRAAFGVAIALIAPLLNVVSLLIQNAAVLVFPAWVQLGPGAQGGIEVMGQRLIFLGGQILAVLLALVPAAVLATIIFFVGKYLAGLVVAVPAAGAAGALVLAVEAGFGVWALGGLFERFDLSAEPAESGV